MSSTGSSPWDLLVLRWGESRTLSVLNKLMSNKPIYKNGTPAVNTAVASGEAPVGLGSIHDTQSLKAKGAPVDWKTYGVDAPGDYIPVLPQGLLVTKKSRHASLGRLFIAWFAMEGISITEKRESTFRITYEDSSLNALLKQRAPNAKVLAPLSNKEFEISNAFDDKVRQVVAGGMRGR
jgi:ABC-type Fe3+ transport system substrate-binding protein